MFRFEERARRNVRAFKGVISAITMLTVVALVAGTAAGRGAIGSFVGGIERWARARVGHDPGRFRDDRAWRSHRLRGIRETLGVYRGAYRRASPEFRHLLDEAGMAPDEAVVRWGNYDLTFILSSKVFEPDDRGRSYRLLPSTTSAWLEQRNLPKPNTGQLLVPDTPAVLLAVGRSGAAILPGSSQSTNSWGCRGPEPDPAAPFRGIGLGDSYMQGVLLPDDRTPPERLRAALARELGRDVSILNTGVLGYSPEQYYNSLREYGERFRPQFVVVSLFANDFGAEADAFRGDGDWEEARYWLGKIRGYCLDRDILLLVTLVVGEPQLFGNRSVGDYPSCVADLVGRAGVSGPRYLDPTETFRDEDLRLRAEAARRGESLAHSPLYNGEIGDGHFSDEGAELWGLVVARRLGLLIEQRTSIRAP